MLSRPFHVSLSWTLHHLVHPHHPDHLDHLGPGSPWSLWPPWPPWPPWLPWPPWPPWLPCPVTIPNQDQRFGFQTLGQLQYITKYFSGTTICKMWKKWSGTIICKICKTFVWNKNAKFARMIHNENCPRYPDWWFAKTVDQKDNLQKNCPQQRFAKLAKDFVLMTLAISNFPFPVWRIYFLLWLREWKSFITFGTQTASDINLWFRIKRGRRWRPAGEMANITESTIQT